MTRFYRSGLSKDDCETGAGRPRPRRTSSFRAGLASLAAGALLLAAGAARAQESGPTTPGVSTIVISAGNGAVLAQNGADIPRYPASLTKLMTLDLAFQALRDHRITLDTTIPVSYHAASVEPVKLGLRPGSTISVQNAILAMVTMSANDAATALGEYLGGGSESRFAEMMTLRAHALGMNNTEFANASGLPNPAQVSTARDLSLLARDLVVNYPEDRGFFEVRSFVYGRRVIPNIDGMLKLYPGATGMKTGYTNLARHNVLTTADRGGRTLIGVILHDNSWGSAYTHMAAMLDSGFAGTGGGLTVASALIPRADAAIPEQRPDIPARTVAARGRARHGAAEVREASAEAEAAPHSSWTAQLGAFSSVRAARAVLTTSHAPGHQGTGRVAALPAGHGHTLWTAQITGLTRHSAWAVCKARRHSRMPCLVIAPNSDELASR